MTNISNISGNDYSNTNKTSMQQLAALGSINGVMTKSSKVIPKKDWRESG
jgi:hypothetical protein